MNSISYKLSVEGAPCGFPDDEEPCWGEVEDIEEIYTGDDEYFVFACQGHRELGKYTPEVVAVG